jgi:hypothetical protein
MTAMTSSHHAVRRVAPAARAESHTHSSVREGFALGLAVASTTWLWLALVDAVAGQPFLTFTVLGGVVAFTVIHYLLNICYGMAILSEVHGAVRAPSLIFGIGFGFLMLEFAFALLSAALSPSALGALVWVRLFGGSLIGAAVAFLVVRRRHRLVELLRKAEAER